MFLAEVLTAITEGLKRTFNDEYPVADFRKLHVSIEYPVAEASYPAIWVGFEPTSTLVRAGINHVEFLEREVDGETRFGQVTRWRFQGTVQYTVISLSSLARARLADEVIRTIGFGELEEGRGTFRDFIEDNPLIPLSMDYDTIEMRGVAETPGTPWGTDDILYEVTMTSRVVGEFLSDPQGILVPLTAIRVYATPEGQDEEPSPDVVIG